MLWDVSATNSEIANTLISKFTYNTLIIILFKMLQWSCKPDFCNIVGLHEAPP